ncbi:MAG: hypothetical protein LC099_12560 [Anaerolineales bacterium]|nr:hypothetical protein [Anaerolineales bacterium]
MTKLVVVLNGAPNSGKDYITRELIKHLAISDITSEELMFKTGLYKETAKQYFMPYYDFVDLATNRSTKDIPNERLGGISPREALINVSENYIKPLLGKDYFAKELLENIKDKDVYIISDGGFKEEIQTLIDSPKISRLLLVHLMAPGCSFEGDSRSYIHHDVLQNHSRKLVIEPIFNSKVDDLCVIELLYLIYKIL